MPTACLSFVSLHDPSLSIGVRPRGVTLTAWVINIPDPQMTMGSFYQQVGHIILFVVSQPRVIPCSSDLLIKPRSQRSPRRGDLALILAAEPSAIWIICGPGADRNRQLAMGQNLNRTPSEHPNPIQPLKWVLRWVVHLPAKMGSTKTVLTKTAS